MNNKDYIKDLRKMRDGKKVVDIPSDEKMAEKEAREDEKKQNDIKFNDVKMREMDKMNMRMQLKDEAQPTEILYDKKKSKSKK